MQPKDPNYPRPTSESVIATMKSNKRSDTRPEILIRSLLHKKGIRFRKDLLIKINNMKCRPDIVFTKVKLAVFIDGCFWHLCPEHGHIPKSNIHYWEPKLNKNKERDIANTEMLENYGWTVLRLWEHLPAQDATEVIFLRLAVMCPERYSRLQ